LSKFLRLEEVSFTPAGLIELIILLSCSGVRMILSGLHSLLTLLGTEPGESGMLDVFDLGVKLLGVLGFGV